MYSPVDDVILYKDRVVIPRSIQHRVLHTVVQQQGMFVCLCTYLNGIGSMAALVLQPLVFKLQMTDFLRSDLRRGSCSLAFSNRADPFWDCSLAILNFNSSSYFVLSCKACWPGLGLVMSRR